MTEYDNTNRLVLFPNDRKEKESHPDWKGEINVRGETFWVSVWEKTTKSGNEMLSGAITEKQQQKPATKAPVDDFVDDDLPF